MLVAAVCALYLVITRPAPILEGWSTEYSEALARAEATDQKLVLAFHQPGCPPCVAMDRLVL